LVGNTPTTDVIVWSLLSMIILFLSLFITFFVYGQFKVEADEEEDERDWQPLTTEDLENRVVRPTQRACYKFFILSAFAFLCQTFAGIVCSIDFVRPWGLSACSILPFTVWRSFHLTFQIYWFFVAWVGTTVFEVQDWKAPAKYTQFATRRTTNAKLSSSSLSPLLRNTRRLLLCKRHPGKTFKSFCRLDLPRAWSFDMTSKWIKSHRCRLRWKSEHCSARRKLVCAGVEIPWLH
jgi:hypothetical protein